MGITPEKRDRQKTSGIHRDIRLQNLFASRAEPPSIHYGKVVHLTLVVYLSRHYRVICRWGK
ncbi:hypothetical protein ACLBOM_37820 [Escherichia coli]